MGSQIVKQSLITFWLLLCAGQVAAFDCPDYYRFVDFGLEDSTGTLNAGGPRVRVEGFDGIGLLKWETATCLDLPFMRRDGFGNIIPVVEGITFDRGVLPVAVFALHLRRQPDIAARAEGSAAPHRTQVAAPQAKVTQGEAFLCVQWGNGRNVSCQFPALDRENLPLIVICGSEVCDLPVLHVGSGLEISATWPAPDDVVANPQSVAPQLYQRVRDIKAFIDTLI